MAIQTARVVQTASDAASRLQELGLVDPLGRPEARRRAAPRLDTLHGKRAGFLDNRKGNGDRLLMRLRDVLQERFQLADTFYTTKFIYARRAAPEILEEFAKKCDFVVTAVGD